jgi:cyclic pyranopterin phosphate synthase
MRLPVLHSGTAPPAQFETGPRSIAAVRVLRISITDRCNFRCVYCMPEEGVRWLPQQEILSFEEIREVARAAIERHGIRRFKLTGGEPTVRANLPELVRMLRQLDGIEDLSLTTNGMRLANLARPLQQAGLDRVTVSIDSLRPDRFKRITRTGDLATVLHGLDCAREAGLGVKINCVTMRGVNDDEFVDFARLSLQRELTVRFIEYMPLGDAELLHRDTGLQPVPATFGLDQTFQAEIPGSSGRQHGLKTRVTVDSSEIGPAGGCGAQDRGRDSLVPETEVRDVIERALGPLEPVRRDDEPGVGPANVYRLAGAMGRIGFISAMSEPFCATCNRLRLTATGVLRSCLFEGGEVAIRPILRSVSDPVERRAAVARAMVDCVRLKPEVHSRHGNGQMSRIGG